jgi:hypothetical protein
MIAMMDTIRSRILCLLSMLWFGQVAAAETIYYPRPESARDQRTAYPVKLLQLALRKANASYQLRPSELVMVQGRALLQIEGNSKYVHVAWSMTSKAREKQVMPIRIPIDKGLLGWRLGMVTKANRDLFAHVASAADLAAFSAASGHDWPDTAILRSNGLGVVDTDKYELLFRMLENGKVAYFPRAVTEIWTELAARKSNGLVVADHLLIYYPAPNYFFVNKHNTKLAAAITLGLERAIADGSFEHLFLQHFGADIERVDFARRRVLVLSNPSLPEETPLDRAALWFTFPD